MEKQGTLTNSDVLRVDKMMLKMLKESKTFQKEREKIRAAVESRWFECDCCGKARRTGNMWVAESYEWGRDIEVCEECREREGPPPGVETRPWPQGLEWQCLDVRFPQVIHGEQIIDQDRHHDKLHQDVAAAIPEELVRWGYDPSSGRSPEEYMAVHFSPFRKLKGRTMDIVQQRIQFVLSACGCSSNIDWSRNSAHIATTVDLALGEKLSSPTFLKWVDDVIDNETVQARDKIMEIEAAMAAIECKEAEGAGLPRGIEGVLHLKAIERFVYETEGGGARKQHDFLASAARLVVRRRIMCLRTEGVGNDRKNGNGSQGADEDEGGDCSAKSGSLSGSGACKSVQGKSIDDNGLGGMGDLMRFGSFRFGSLRASVLEQLQMMDVADEGNRL